MGLSLGRGKRTLEGSMKKLSALLLAIAGVVTIYLLAKDNTKLPEGWFVAGNKPAEFEMGVDNSVYESGKSSAFIKSKNPSTNEFGTLMQSISAENYLDKRLRLSSFIKSKDINGWSGMWMRIDGEKGELLGFDNMQARPIKGTTDWKQYEIVLDVPASSKTINYGVLLGADGEVWFDNLKLGVVDKNVPVTSQGKEMNLSKEPVNLDFEE